MGSFCMPSLAMRKEDLNFTQISLSRDVSAETRRPEPIVGLKMN